jgi:ribosomal protein S18 acetylase RimI-like enzyme
MQTAAQRAGYAASFPEARDFVIVDEGGDAVGRLLLDETPSRARVVDLAVHPTAQRRGVATAALRDLMTRVPVVELRVDRTNHRAIALYEHLGFAVVTADDLDLEMRWVGR